MNESIKRLHKRLLEGVLHVHHPGHAVADGGFESLFDLVLDDEDDRLEACAAGVVQGIIHDDLTAGTHRVDLLHAAVAAAHAGSQTSPSLLTWK